MFEKELELLLEKNWTEEEITMINRLLETLQYYKKLIPKSLKQEIVAALQMCNTLKTELDTFREKCKCIHKELNENISLIEKQELDSEVQQIEQQNDTQEQIEIKND